MWRRTPTGWPAANRRGYGLPSELVGGGSADLLPRLAGEAGGEVGDTDRAPRQGAVVRGPSGGPDRWCAGAAGDNRGGDERDGVAAHVVPALAGPAGRRRVGRVQPRAPAAAAQGPGEHTRVHRGVMFGLTEGPQLGRRHAVPIDARR